MSKKNNEFSIEEYTSIRAELIERIKNMNSQEASALVAIITSWAAGFTFANEILTKKFIMLDSFGTVVFQCLQTFIFLIPIFYFVPLAIKSGENLTQMVSLSAYIRVFYDYPFQKKYKKMNWETSNNLLSVVNTDKKEKSVILKMSNEEYTILAISSYLIYKFFEVISIKQLIQFVNEREITTNVYIIIILMYVIFNITSIGLIFLIHKSSSTKNTMMDKTKIYVNAYLNRAIELGVIDEKMLKNAIDELNPEKDMIIRKFL